MKIIISAALLFIFLIGINTLSQTFTKITTGSFVNDGGASRSVNFIDYDGDGDLDLFVSNGKRYGQYNFMYQNIAGTYTRIFNLGVTQDSLPFDGSSWVDFDNDGDLDMCAVTWYDSISVLYQNNSGTFVLLSSSPVVTDRGFSEDCSWGDYDNDGLVDILITNSAGSSHRNRLYKNTGNGNFVRIDSGAIFNDVNFESRGVNWIDIDGDRDLDLFICNESGGNEIMYKNEGGGYFTKVLGITPVTSGGSTQSASWGDYDNDGDFDIFAANCCNQKNMLFKNEGNFNFTRILSDTIVNDFGYYVCTGWGDYDNDGDLDMFVTQAYKSPNSPLKNNLYKNILMETGTAVFEKISTGDIVNDGGYSYGFSWGDFDADGDLDIFIAKTYNETENNACYINNGNPNKWIEIKCTGTITNRSAIGTKVRIKAIINGNPVWQIREVNAQSGYCGQLLDLHFGLGNAAVIDSIRVEWPSGITQHFTDEHTNRIIRIDETQGIIGINKINELVPGDFNLYQNFPNPFNPETKIRFSVPSVGNLKDNEVKLIIYDANGKQVAALFNGKLSPGNYEAVWNGINYSSGIYYYRLQSGNYSETMKMVFVK